MRDIDCGLLYLSYQSFDFLTILYVLFVYQFSFKFLT